MEVIKGRATLPAKSRAKLKLIAGIDVERKRARAAALRALRVHGEDYCVMLVEELLDVTE